MSDDKEVNIPDEAVEAAVDALLGALANDGAYIQEDDGPGKCVIDGYLLDVPAAIRKALESAAPHLMAQAWNESVIVLYRAEAIDRRTMRIMTQQNPYRSAGAGE